MTPPSSRFHTIISSPPSVCLNIILGVGSVGARSCVCVCVCCVCMCAWKEVKKIQRSEKKDTNNNTQITIHKDTNNSAKRINTQILKTTKTQIPSTTTEHITFERFSESFSTVSQCDVALTRVHTTARNRSSDTPYCGSNWYSFPIIYIYTHTYIISHISTHIHTSTHPSSTHPSSTPPDEARCVCVSNTTWHLYMNGVYQYMNGIYIWMASIYDIYRWMASIYVWMASIYEWRLYMNGIYICMNGIYIDRLYEIYIHFIYLFVY